MRVGRRRWAIAVPLAGVAAAASAVLAPGSAPGVAAAVPPPASRPTTQPAPAGVGRQGHHDPVLPPPLPPVGPPPASQPATAAVVVPPVPKPQPATAPATQPAVAPPAPAVTVTPAVPVPDPVAYWAGLAAGRRVRQRLAEDGRGFDDLAVLKGFIDGLADHETAYPRADVQAAADQLQANVLQRRAERRSADEPAFRRLADDDQQRSRDLLAVNAKLVGVRVRPDGVQVRVLRDGTGRPVAGAKVIAARLSVSLADGTLLAAADPAGPARLALADCLPALADAARDMRVGDRWQVVLPPERAYGLAGNPPMVGPNQALAYELEVVEAQ